MIQRLDINSVHATIDDRLHKYITKKIGYLDHYVPRAARTSTHAEVWLKEAKSSENKQFTCEVTLHLPHEIINVSESMSNAFSAVDIVEAKLKQQIGKYKQMHATGALRRRLASRAVKKLSA